MPCIRLSKRQIDPGIFYFLKGVNRHVFEIHLSQLRDTFRL